MIKRAVRSRSKIFPTIFGYFKKYYNKFKNKIRILLF